MNRLNRGLRILLALGFVGLPGTRLVGSADELEWYARELMRLPFAFEVRAPAELRSTIARLAGELARRCAP